MDLNIIKNIKSSMLTCFKIRYHNIEEDEAKRITEVLWTKIKNLKWFKLICLTFR